MAIRAPDGANKTNLFAQEQIFLCWGLVVKPLPSDEALNHSSTFQNISHITVSYNMNLLMSDALEVMN